MKLKISWTAGIAIFGLLLALVLPGHLNAQNVWQAGGQLGNVLLSGANLQYPNGQVVNSTTPLPTSQGGTGASSLSGLATAGANSNITSLTGLTTPLSVAQGGSGAATLTGALVGHGTSAMTGGTLSAANGGTGTTLLTAGTATFATAGSVAVADATIDASSVIEVTEVGTGAADHYSVALTPTTGFTIYSSNATSTATVMYFRVK